MRFLKVFRLIFKYTCLGSTKEMPFFCISAILASSSLKSFFKPTKMTGTPGQRELTSSIHYIGYYYKNNNLVIY
jgi:hypothetical protein